MTVKNSATLVDYYHNELGYLKKAGRDFAKAYPKVAKRLDISEEEIRDPHVERLVESFAFLTARLQKQIDEDFLELAQQLLNAVYPQFSTPVPSMSVAQFFPDSSKMKSPKGQMIPKGTTLEIKSAGGIPCKFQTCQESTLWPLKIEEAKIVNLSAYDIKIPKLKNRNALYVKIKRMGPDLRKLQLDKLSFYLSAPQPLVGKLYDGLFQETLPVLVKGDKEPNIHVKPQLKSAPGGLGLNEDALPYPGNAHPAYRLLMEYFIFPKKFNFINVKGLGAVEASDYIELYFPLSYAEDNAGLEIAPDNIKLGCVPIVNLFTKTAEPINLDYKNTHYKLIGDKRYEKYTEVYAINKVTAVSEDRPEPQTISPYYAYSYNDEALGTSRFWHASRKAAEASDTVTSETYLSFVDLKMNPLKSKPQTVYAYTLCTNGTLPESIPAGATLTSSLALPTLAIKCIESPSAPIPPVFTADAYWQVISHLNVSLLSLKESGLEGLKSMLKMYARGQSAKAVEAITSITYEPCVRRLLSDSWRGFVKGTQVKLRLEGELTKEICLSQFGNVLRQFFALYTDLNSFTELELYKEKDDTPWKQWLPASGSQELL